MITLAFDTASDRCTVAATNGSQVAHRDFDGARGHAAAILVLLDEVLGELDATPRSVTALLTGDGPGSFTGLRVSSTVAKALSWHRPVIWRTASSLLVRAAAHTTAGGSTVLALSDALRGEVYAGCWRIGADGVVAVGPSPQAMTPAALRDAFGVVDIVVGTVPDALVDAIREATDRALIRGTDALPDARTLLALVELDGATALVDDPEAWQPVYGRPAEAQAVWERTHGRELPAAPGIHR